MRNGRYTWREWDKAMGEVQLARGGFCKIRCNSTAIHAGVCDCAAKVADMERLEARPADKASAS